MLFPWPLWYNMLLVFHLLSLPSPFSFFGWGFLLKTTFKFEPSSSLSSDLSLFSFGTVSLVPMTSKLFPQLGKTLCYPHILPRKNGTRAPLLVVSLQLTTLLWRPNKWADWEDWGKMALALVTTQLACSPADQRARQLGWRGSIQEEGVRNPNNGCKFQAVFSNSTLSAIKYTDPLVVASSFLVVSEFRGGGFDLCHLHPQTPYMAHKPGKLKEQAQR